MRRRAFELLIGLGVLGGALPASAAGPRHGTARGYELANGTPTREVPELSLQAPPPGRGAAWRRLSQRSRAWARWNTLTDVPSRIYLEGIDVPGVMENADVAAAFAKKFLEEHADLLAPGASASDFTLVTNEVTAGMRTLGFTQSYRGVPVLGGQVSFRFRNDRLFMIGSEALPNVELPNTTPPRAPQSALSAGARAAVVSRKGGSARVVATDGETTILPIVRTGEPLSYREVVRVEVAVDGTSELMEVLVDAGSAEGLASSSNTHEGTSGLRAMVPSGHPQNGRFEYPLPGLRGTIAGVDHAADPTGSVTYPGATASLAIEGVAGDLLSIEESDGMNASTVLALSDGENAIWSESEAELEAQLSVYAHVMRAREYILGVSPEFPRADWPLVANVNVSGACNANFVEEPYSLNFFQAGGGCPNMGLVSGLIYHEYGHAIHVGNFLPGVGIWSGGVSEGAADYFAATVENTPEIADGFYIDGPPLRRLDPDGYEWHWPEDRQGYHREGQILAGALWDLREALIEKLGDAEGVSHTDFLWYEGVRRSTGMPSVHAEVLALDDDDGNLANGTPNACEINAAFGAHGLFSGAGGEERVQLQRPGGGGGLELTVERVVPVYEGCGENEVAPVAYWRLRDTPEDEMESAMALGADGVYRLTLPEPEPGSVLEYRVQLNYADGSRGALPRNHGDPWYEYFVGEVLPLRCLGDGEEWGYTVEGTQANWEVGPWNSEDRGIAGPSAPYNDGPHVFTPGGYLPNANTTIHFDPVAAGEHENVRLQFMRWLSVEDATYDRAAVVTNGTDQWRNETHQSSLTLTNDLADREWVFRDVDVSYYADATGEGVSVGFRHYDSDGSIQWGGWVVADLCVVAFDPELPFCGDGYVDDAEACDDGNHEDGDGCDRRCMFEEEGGSSSGGEESSSSGSSGSDTGDLETTGTSGDGGETGASTSGEPGAGSTVRDDGCSCRGGGAPRTSWSLWLLLSVGLLRRRPHHESR